MERPSLTGVALIICLQEVPEKSKDAAGAPWQFIGLLPLFDPPRHDSAETIRRALHLGVNVKMITGKIRDFVFFLIFFSACKNVS